MNDKVFHFFLKKNNNNNNNNNDNEYEEKIYKYLDGEIFFQSSNRWEELIINYLLYLIIGNSF